MSSDNKPLTKEELNDLGNRVLNYFGGREQLQYYWKTTIGNEINELAISEFGISLYRMKQVVLGVLQIEDKTKEDVKLLKQKAWEARPEYTQEQVAEMNAKRKVTCRERYGVDYIQQSDIMKERSRATCFAKYGVYNINSWEELRRRKSELQKNRTEEENALIVAKREQTCIEKYGVKNPFQNEDIVAKCLATKEQRYGDVNYNNRSKAKDTCLERYGTEYYSQTADTLQRKKYRCYCVDDIYFDSYPELAIYMYYTYNKIPIKRTPVRLAYKFNNKIHYCFPDFQIAGQLVEVKGDHLYQKLLVPHTKDNAKFKCLMQNEVAIWTKSTYKSYIKWFEGQGFKKEDYLV